MQNWSEVRGSGRISRRRLLAHLAAFAAAGSTNGARAQTPLVPSADDDPLRQLRPGHPRIILLDADLDRLRALTRDNPLGRRLYGELEKECDRLLSIPPVEYKIAALRLGAQTHRALERIVTLSLMYRISGRDPWLRRAVMEMNAAASFRDWNPGHFIDAAEMTHAFAIGYDWLYNALAPEERTAIRDAILSRSLAPALSAFQAQSAWTRDRGYWSAVCNSGLALGALAIADEAKDEATQIFRYVLQSVPHGIANYTADGGWPEGPYFWELSTRALCVLFSALETSLGTDFGLSSPHALERTGRFRVYLTGPTNRLFNFGDNADDPGSAPEMFWMARRYSAPVYAWYESKEAERSPRPDAYDLVWLDRDARAPQPPAWPLDAVFHSVNIATFRSAWDDPNALFLAVRGGDNKVPHTHLDLGAFVLDAGGFRWAIDPGPDELPPVAGPGRGRLLPLAKGRSDLHNTVVIDGENQDPRGEAHIVRQETGADLSWVQVDLSRAYPKLKSWTRKVGMAHRQSVLIEDYVRSDQPVEAIWGMMTDADISSSGQSATLHKPGWNLAAEIMSPRHAIFDQAPPHLNLPNGSQGQNLRRLIVRLSDKVTDLDLVISLAPYREGQPRPKVNIQFPE